MPTDLQHELHQTRPFSDVQEEAALNLLRTASVIEATASDFFKGFGLSAAQYNVLRILRGAGAEGLGRNEIRERLISRMPDVTRLIDRLEAQGFVTRTRSTSDRRCVPTTLTPKALALLAEIDPRLGEAHRQWFAHLRAEELRQLITLLTRVRHPEEG